jgi:peptidoglycan L-alanyl-D-glutamate endopeptidase CwlK
MPRTADPAFLHPSMRAACEHLENALKAKGIPLARYEGGRSPLRQLGLYSQGRVSGIGTSGKFVTRAKPWQSFHQFGLAADYVFQINGQWTWVEPEAGMWDEYTKTCEALSLRTLSFERPHVELPWNMALLGAGKYPPGGDESWKAWLDAQIESWGHDARDVNGITMPGAPPSPTQGERPPLAA